MRLLKHGFTLIELIVVTVLLGVLGAVAAPRFIDLSSDARVSSLEALEGSMRSASRLVNLKATIEDKLDCATDPTVEMHGATISLRCGFPCPHPSGITNAVITEAPFNWVGGNCGGQLGFIEVQISDAPDPNNCKIRYTSARETQEPGYTITSSGC